MATIIAIARRDAKRAPMETLETALVSTATGVSGDFRGRPGKRQVSVLSSESWQLACQQLGRELPWTTRRANLLVSGMVFGADMIGRRLRAGDLILEIMDETDPCSRMEEAAAGLYEALLPDWRGGVLCRVLEGGEIRCGDSIGLV